MFLHRKRSGANSELFAENYNSLRWQGERTKWIARANSSFVYCSLHRFITSARLQFVAVIAATSPPSLLFAVCLINNSAVDFRQFKLLAADLISLSFYSIFTFFVLLLIDAQLFRNKGTQFACYFKWHYYFHLVLNFRHSICCNRESFSLLICSKFKLFKEYWLFISLSC